MTLFIVGMGLSDYKDITLRGLEAVKTSDKVFLETYTSYLDCSIKELEVFFEKPVIPANRSLVESNANQILNPAKEGNSTLLVIGDPFSATTHVDLVQRAQEQGIKVEIVNNASVLNAVGRTGLQLYKFGKVASIPFQSTNKPAVTPYEVLKNNKSIGLHTLFLLDLDPENDKFLAVNDALGQLFEIEKEYNYNIITSKTKAVVCARLGWDSQIIKYDSLEELRMVDFGKPPFCIIIPGNLHFIEEEFLEK